MPPSLPAPHLKCNSERIKRRLFIMTQRVSRPFESNTAARQ